MMSPQSYTHSLHGSMVIFSMFMQLSLGTDILTAPNCFRQQALA